MAFPVAPCDFCNKLIKDNSGFIACADFTPFLGHLVNSGCIENAVKEPVVEVVTSAYFDQFSEIFTPEHPDGVTLRELHQDRTINANAHVYRLRRVLDEASKLGKHGQHQVYLLIHRTCFPKSIDDWTFVYDIDLRSIHYPADGIEWTIHLSEKLAWNPVGWAQMLEKLYGRKSC